MNDRTQTGIPIVLCRTCDHRHPETREHCAGCGTASIFLNDEQMCLNCRECDA